MCVWCDTLAANGYTAMTIDYYDWSNATLSAYPKPVRAFKTAVQFLRRNATRFRITSGRIVGFGQSEGAVHWGETIIWDNDYNYFQTDSTISDHLDAAVLFYGLYDNNNYLASTAPLETFLSAFLAPNPKLRSTKGDCIANAANITAPVLLLHGTHDNSLVYQQSVQLHDSLVAQGKTCQLVLGPWDHLFDTYNPPPAFTPEGLLAKDTVIAFLHRIILVTSIPSAHQDYLPREDVLDQNYPNPFNPGTTIQFSIPRAAHVILRVFSTVGQEIAALVSEDLGPGSYTRRWDASGFASGVYFYRIQVGSFTQTRKLLVLK